VTGNASIAGRSLFVTFLAFALALLFVVTLAGDADARHRRPTRRFSTAAFTSTNDFQGTGQPFQAPDRFSCRFDDSPSVHGYVCEGGGMTFTLSEVLVRSGNTDTSLQGFDGLATPDRFRCRWDGNAAGDKSAEHFICKYRHRDSAKGPQHTHTFRVNEIVSVTDLPNPDDADPDGKDDLWLPPHPLTTPTPTPTPEPKPTATKTPAAVPTAVPAGTGAAGTDAAGGGSAAGLVGLVLAAGGVVAGAGVIARRRILHDS
jgi:hypothetical protein